MDKKEMHNKFEELYKMIIDSEDESKMEVLGHVVKKQMEWMIENRPDMAEENIEMLCAVRWNNYLTKKEAEMVVSKMMPTPRWTREQVMRELEQMGEMTEEAPYYNECALYATISMITSDSLDTLVKYAFDTTKEDVVDKDILTLCYHLALDKLKDKDKRFNIRRYFEL